MKYSQLKATAYHEAGHAVAAWRLIIALSHKGVTIVPDQEEGSDGSVFHRKIVGKDVEYDHSGRNVLKTERLVQVSLAGEVAQRRYNSRSLRSYHSESDRQKAMDVLSYLATSDSEVEAWLKLLYIRTENMLSNPDIWRAVEQLAAELMQKQTICGKDATEIIRRGFLSPETAQGCPKTRR